MAYTLGYDIDYSARDITTLATLLTTLLAREVTTKLCALNKRVGLRFIKTDIVSHGSTTPIAKDITTLVTVVTLCLITTSPQVLSYEEKEGPSTCRKHVV